MNECPTIERWQIYSLYMVTTYSAVGSKLLLGGGLNQKGFGGMLPQKIFALPKPQK
jgi:hypothetical protein